MDDDIKKYYYAKKSFFRDSFPFAIRKLSNRPEEFNLTKWFHRQFWKIAYIVKGSGNYVIGEQMLPFTEKTIIVTPQTTWAIKNFVKKFAQSIFKCRLKLRHSEFERLEFGTIT